MKGLINMRKTFLAAAALTGVALSAAPASAAVIFDFAPGAPSPAAGFTVINTFDNAIGITGSDFEIKTPPADSEGAPPANSSPAGTAYLSVLGGGDAEISFAPTSAFQFDWGSVDTYNTLTILLAGSGDVVYTGADVTSPANGNQIAPGTNGRFTVTGTEGEMFTGIRLTSSANSFEIDNLAVVPEPATWAIMMLGFGIVGLQMRRRKAVSQVRFA